MARHRIRTVVVLLVVVFLGATARLFVWPATDGPAKADAVVALGGDPGQRRAHQALELAREGYAPVAVISLGGIRPVPCPRSPGRVEVICFRANPLDTRGEAEYVARLVHRRRWRSIIVVPEKTQSTRARLLFKRCTAVPMRMVPVDDRGSRIVFDIAYEWGALLKALVLVRSC
ncbi:MAG TPA: ElyC/SanA/YdcF family protein [Acidimicrobiales bacterium]|nr:ElyC/SanA/YdcF family protein [Acidimicrobiales bacterium]